MNERRIERRCRYRFRLHGLRVHKVNDDDGRAWYYITEAGGDQARPEPDDPYRWYDLDQLLNCAEELEEQDREWLFEERARRA